MKQLKKEKFKPQSKIAKYAYLDYVTNQHIFIPKEDNKFVKEFSVLFSTNNSNLNILYQKHFSLSKNGNVPSTKQLSLYKHFNFQFA